MRHDAANTADGTQPSEPSWTFADPLAGISRSGNDHPNTKRTSNGGDGGGATPASPNPDTVRSLLNDVFDPAPQPAAEDSSTTEDEPVAEGDAASSDRDGAPVTPVQWPEEETRPGMLPRQRRTWPTRRRLARQAWRPRRRPAFRKPARTQAAREQATPNPAPPSLKPTRGFAGVTIAIVLLLLFGFVALEFVVSFVGMFTGSGG